MSEWTIYHNDNTELTVVKELEYHDEWMADGYVSVTVKSATPVGFSIGDYLEYRGERFEINYDPNLIKRAKSGSYGDGFVYENVKLYSQSARLKDVGFLDYVLNWDSASNKNVYSSQGTFAFYAESVEDLADRIQANLDRHSNGEWLVLTPNWSRSSQRGATTDWWTGYFDGTWGGAIRTEGKTDVSVSADNLSCRDALNLSYTAFDLSYYVTSKTVTSGQTSTTKKLVIIGGKSVSASHIFKYGKGNGLYEIERTSDDSERIITKLFAYGSDKNLPLNFYANIGKKMFFTLVTKTSRTIIMGNDTLLLWTDIPWTDKLDNAFAPSYYPVRLEYTNQSQQYFAANFGVMGDTYTFGDEKDDDSTILDHTTKYLVFYILSSYTGAESFYGAVSADSKIYITSGVNLNKLPESMIETPLVYDYPALLSISKLMLPGFPSQSLFDWVVNNGATNIDYNNYKAKWHGHTAYFSTDPHNPWIMSLRADEIGVREGTVNFDGSAGEDEIYPTIEGRSDGYNNRADAVAWAEQMDDSGYLGENPKDSAKLFKFKPNMVDGIFIDWTDNDGDVAVTMKDGPCVGREFKMNSARLNDDGDWEITLERQQDTSLLRYFPYKEPDSDKLFQVLGSENAISGADVNHFIVTGINLPESFVEIASQKLLEKALEQLDKKDHQSFTYLPKVDEIYMKRQDDAVQAGRDAATYGTVSLHDTLRAGMQMRIKDTDLDIDYRPFIDVLTIKENGNNGIPTYDVVLRDEKELTMQQRIQSQIEGGKDAILNLGGDGSSYPLTSEFLSRLKDDEAKGLITFLKGLQVGDRFVTGLLGEGGIFRKDADGKTYIEADKLYIRMKAYFDTVEVRKFIHSGGNRIASPAGGKCVRVEYMAQYNGQWVVVDENGVYTWRDSQGVKHTATPANGIEKIRCYFRGEDDGMTVTNDWQVGDQAYCKVTNERLNMHMFWRLVIGTSGNTLTDDGEFWIDLSNKDTESITSVTYAGKMDGSDLPIAQDSIVQLGNVDDPDRRGAIIEFVTAENSPSYQIFQNLGEPAPAGSSTSEMKAAQFSYDDKYYIGFGFNSETNRAYMDVYGDFFFGAKEVDGVSPTYIKYTQVDEETGQPKLEIKAVIEGSSPIAGTNTTIGQELSDLWDEIGDLQSQIDGSIETWFEEYMPVAKDQTGAPANRVPLISVTVDGRQIPCEPYATWYMADHGGQASEVNTERLKHLGDIFYDNSSGYAFRFSQNESTDVFEWVPITDSAVIKALADAAAAYGLADTKNKIFTTVAGQLPPVPYKEGDLWVNATYDATGSIYSNDILKCVHGRTSQESADRLITDWTLASKYTNDARVEHYMGILAGLENYDKDVPKEVALATANAIDNALGGTFVIEGGLMLMSLIGMRQFVGTTGQESDPTKYTTWAGISGEYDDWSTTHALGHGIAAWYGGDMVDKEMLSASDISAGWGVNYRWARSLDRFDGSGYRADGNISWDAAGGLTLKNVTWGDDDIRNFFNAFAVGVVSDQLNITPKGDFSMLNVAGDLVIGGHLTYNEQTHTATITGGSSVATQTWVRNNYVEKTFFAKLFQAYDSNGNPIAPNEANDTTRVVDNIRAMVGFWTNQYLSAKGLNSSSGGSGGVGDVTWDLLANSSDTRPIALSHLTTALSSYATQSWVSSQGYLTSIPTASSSTKGGVKVGNTLAISSEVLNLASVTITAPATGDTTYTKVYVDGYGRVTKATTLSDTDIPSLAASKITSGTLDAARIPNLSWTKITTDKPTTLSGYGITDGVKNDTTWWGRSISGGAVKGSIEKATSLEFDNIGSSANNGGYIDFHYNGDNTSNSGDYTSRIIEDQSGIIKINNTLFAKLSGGVTIGTSTVGSNYKLEVSGVIGLTGSTKRIYFSDTNHYIELDSNGYFHFSHGLYSDSFVSAKGLNSNSGSGITLNEPLNGINNAGLSAPTSSASGQTVVWNGSAWTYSINTTLRAGNLASAGSASIYGNIDSSTGKLRMPRNGGGIAFYLDSTYGYTTAMRVFMGSTTLSLGYETAHDASYDTNIYGYNIGLIYGNSSGYGIFINSSGNVGIGITTNNTYKLQVNGTAFASSFMVAESGTAYRLPHKIKLNNSFYYPDSNGMVDLGTVGGGGSGDLSNYVTLNTNQEITGFKSFSGAAYIYGISYQNLFVGTTNQAKTPCIAFFESSTGTQNTYGGLCMKSENGSLFRYTKNVASLYTIWDSGNDGSGSSLDADLLDGQHGSYYATASDVTTLQGYFTSGVANSAKRLAQSSDGVTSLSSFIHSTDLIYMAAGGGNTIADKPSGVTAFGALSFKVASGYYGQILYATNGHMYIRESDTLSGGWTEIITSAIIGSQTVSTASKLSTVSQTLFGNTYWTSGGVPTSVGYDNDHKASLNYVNNITASGNITAGGSITSNGGIVVVDSNAVHDMGMWWLTNNSIDYFNMYAYETKYWNICIGYHVGSASYGALVLDADNGRWGIGTSSPSQKLDVNGDVKANNFRGALIGNADTATTATTASKLSAVSKTAWGRTYWTSDGVPDSISGDIDYAANVTMSGYLKMQRNGGAIQFYLDSTNGYTTAMRVFEGSNSLSLGYETAGLGYETIIYGDNVQLHYGTSRALGFYLNSVGNVGIGTSSPSAMLDVNGSANVSGDLTVNGGNINISNNKYIYWKDSGGTSRTAIFLSDSNNFRVGYGMASAGYDTIISGNNIKFTYGTSRTDGFMLNNSGDVGIGTTSPSEKLHVVGNILASGSTANGTYIQIGDIRIVYDNAATNGNNALKVVKSDGTAANFYATGAVSALGANTSSGGSGIYVPITGDTAMTGDLYPNTTGRTVLLGRNTNTGRWSTIYGVTGDFSSSVSATSLYLSGGATISGRVGIHTDADNNYYLKVNGLTYATKLLVNSTSYTTGHNLYVVGTSYLDGNTTVTGNLTVSGTVKMCSSKVTASATTVTYSGNTFNVIKFAAASNYGFYLAGTPCFGGAGWTNISDIRKKNIIKNVGASIEQIASAPIFDFKFKDKMQNLVMLGSSAQYWQTVFPNAIKEFDGTLTMDYSATALAAAVVTARTVQNHEARIRLLEVENEALRNEINKLKNAA